MACSANTEQWTFTGGKPSRASITARFVSFKASSIVLPLISSVAIELVAIAAPQPKVLNVTSVITLFSTLMYILIMSPHLELPTSPMPFASASSPTFLGFAKWSITLSLYAMLITFLFHVYLFLLIISSHNGEISLR